MKIGVNTVKRGNVLVINGTLHEVLNFYTTQPGKGGAFAQIKLKNLESGAIFEKRFRTAENVERATLEDKQVQYLYNDGTDFHFMETATYDQFSLSKDVVGDKAGFMLENMDLTIKYHGNRPLSLELPPSVNLQVTYTEPGVKGNTASGNPQKKAVLETGLEIQVPLFIENEERLKIDTRSGEYIERAK